MLDRIFRRKRPTTTAERSTEAQAGPECPHLALTPRWDSLADMGHEERATSFVCDGCHQTLTPAEAARARATAASHVRIAGS